MALQKYIWILQVAKWMKCICLIWLTNVVPRLTFMQIIFLFLYFEK